MNNRKRRHEPPVPRLETCSMWSRTASRASLQRPEARNALTLRCMSGWRRSARPSYADRSIKAISHGTRQGVPSAPTSRSSAPQTARTRSNTKSVSMRAAHWKRSGADDCGHAGACTGGGAGIAAAAICGSAPRRPGSAFIARTLGNCCRCQYQPGLALVGPARTKT